jgi:hypothetical protein
MDCKEKSVLHVGRNRLDLQMHFDLSNVIQFSRKINPACYNYVIFIIVFHEPILVKY